MIHNVDRELGLALDSAIKEFSLEGVLDAPKQFDKWSNDCEPLNSISTYQLAKYIIDGYDYPKSKEELFDSFFTWFKEYKDNTPYPTKNSSYRRGRRNTIEDIEKKLIELNILD